jgi:TPR repeat protein
MRLVLSGSARIVEWMAPEDVLRAVRRDYLEAVEWLHQAERDGRQPQRFLTGAMLVGAAQRLWTRANTPLFIGALRADHRLVVRRFSEGGESCIIIDHQTQRRMATYHSRTDQRAATQDLGDAAVVYQMNYDQSDGRWKLAAFVQELPRGWERHSIEGARGWLVEVYAVSPFDTSGRDA